MLTAEDLQSFGFPHSMEYAFLNCGIRKITIPSGVARLNDNCLGYFDDKNGNYFKYKDFEITGYKATAAKTYADKNDIDFHSLDGIEISPIVIGCIIGAVVLAGIVVFIVVLVKKKSEY